MKPVHASTVSPRTGFLFAGPTLEQINVVLSGSGLQRQEIATACLAITGLNRHYRFVIVGEVKQS
jgi:hypothetical protein